MLSMISNLGPNLLETNLGNPFVTVWGTFDGSSKSEQFLPGVVRNLLD